jgi:Plasmid pRiA4b ORF-3-like protein
VGRSAAMSPRGPASIHQVKVTLVGIRPPIWRRLQVASSINLRRLHDVIQEALGWTQSHLYRFEVGDVEFGEPDPEDGRPVRSAKATPLRKIAPEAGAAFLYEYDFGDSWQHQIVVEKVLPPGSGVAYPRCVAGRRACPPEDCGGVWGYAELLEAIGDPEHPEHEEMLEWVGGAFDPEAFDVRAINEALASLGPSPWDARP